MSKRKQVLTFRKDDPEIKVEKLECSPDIPRLTVLEHEIKIEIDCTPETLLQAEHIKAKFDMNELDGTKRRIKKAIKELGTEYMKMKPTLKSKENSAEHWRYCRSVIQNLLILTNLAKNFEDPYYSDRKVIYDDRWCLCNKPQGDNNMILCSNDLCPFIRFHFNCVNIKERPHKEWFCPICFADRL